ncbi:hypothetical protein PROFUN_07916, partial [Planoprotostelium fungivorum]
MKRQKPQDEDSVIPERLALGVVFTSDRARGIIPHFIADIRQQDSSSDDATRFWRTVSKKIVVLDQTYVVVILKQTKEENQIAQWMNTKCRFASWSNKKKNGVE